MKESSYEKPNVKLVAYSKGLYHIGPEELSVYGALGCFEEKSPSQLYLEDKVRLSREKLDARIEKILDETSGRGHGAVLDQNSFTFVLENVPRLVTLQLCLPQYLMHLQQSLRRANAGRGFYIPPSIRESRLLNEAVSLLNSSFALYEQMRAIGIPGEDARFVLPLYTRTNIQTTGDARELMHLHHMSRQGFMPSIIRETIDMMMSELIKVAPRLFKERATNYEALAWYPSAQLFAPENETLEHTIDRFWNKQVSLLSYAGFPLSSKETEKAVMKRDEAELANLKHIHFTFLAKMSIACFHQAIRQRTWDQSVESIYHAAERAEFITPPSIKRSPYALLKYDGLNTDLLELYWDLISLGIPRQEAVGVLPHSLALYDLIHINGWNAIHSIGKRTCREAQWEIRAIANRMAGMIRKENPVLGRYVQPQGVNYGRCPEKNPCDLCDKILARLSSTAKQG